MVSGMLGHVDCLKVYTFRGTVLTPCSGFSCSNSIIHKKVLVYWNSSLNLYKFYVLYSRGPDIQCGSLYIYVG